jgi:hypothetical protein
VSPRGIEPPSHRAIIPEEAISGSEQVVTVQQNKVRLLKGLSVWRNHTWHTLQHNYSIKLEAMKERIDSMKASSSSSDTPGKTYEKSALENSLRTPGANTVADMRTFVINSPSTYKGGDGLLNKLYEAQLFIQQAVAENSALRNYVHLLRAIHAWTLGIEGGLRRKTVLRRVVRNFIKAALFKTLRR